MKRVLKTLALPLIFLAALISLLALWRIFQLPQEAELFRIIRSYFERYGFLTVFISAIVEGMLLLGWYYPGSIVVFLGVIFAGRNVMQVIAVVGIATIGFFIAYVFDYLLGKYGWYRLLLAFGLREPIENAKQRLTRYGANTILVGYFHPNFGALIATAAGILSYPFRTFLIYSLVAVIFWDTFWGTLAYFLSEAALYILGIRFAIIAIVVWILFRLLFMRKRDNQLVGQSDAD